VEVVLVDLIMVVAVVPVVLLLQLDNHFLQHHIQS
tara:strand:- start:699 stop:803 length:105 start_codon:yes stop_codon:yes gene_type:complete